MLLSWFSLFMLKQILYWCELQSLFFASPFRSFQTRWYTANYFKYLHFCPTEICIPALLGQHVPPGWAGQDANGGRESLRHAVGPTLTSVGAMALWWYTRWRKNIVENTFGKIVRRKSRIKITKANHWNSMTGHIAFLKPMKLTRHRSC